MAIRFDEIELSAGNHNYYPVLSHGGNGLQITTSTGSGNLGSGNTSYFHISTDRGTFYFSKPLSINGNIASYGGTHTASFATYYDSNNTNYYVNPASNSVMNNIQIEDYISHKGDPSSDTYFGFPSNDHFTVVTAGGTGLTIDSNRNSTFGAPVWIPDYIYHVGDTNTYFGFPAADTYFVVTNGTEKMKINSGGEMILGTGSGNAGFLDFDGNNLQFNTQRNPNSGAFIDTGKSHAHIGLQGPNGGSNIIFGTAAANNTVATTRMRIHGGGAIQGYVDMRAPVFYDSNDTNYYVNPASGSVLGGTINIHADSDSSLSVQNAGTNAIGIFAHAGDELYLGSNNASCLRLVSGGDIEATGHVLSKGKKQCTASISNSYVRVYSVSTDSSQLASIVKVTGTSHGNSHVGAFTAEIIVNHHQDVNITSSCGNYTDGVIKVESDSNGQYTMSYKSGSSNAATYYFTIEALSSEIDITTNPTSTASTNTTHEHKLIFGTSMSAEGGSEPNLCFASNDGDTNVKLKRSGDGLQIKTGNSGQYTHEFHQGGTFYTKQLIDIDSTGYYLDPGSTSTSLKVAGDIELDNDGGQIKFTPASYDDWEISVDSQGFVIYNMTDSRYDLKISATGDAVFGGKITATTDVVAYSDERLKTDIETLDGSKVYKMRGVSFTKDEKDGSGVIAQELEKVAPELVSNDSEYKAVAYGNITGYLIEAIKDLKKEIEELKKQIK